MNEIRRRRRQLRGLNHDSVLPPGNLTPVRQIAPLRKSTLLARQRNVVHGGAAAASGHDVRGRRARASGRDRSRACGPQQPSLHTCGQSGPRHRAHRDSRTDTLNPRPTFGWRPPAAAGRQREGAHQAQQSRSTWSTHSTDLRRSDRRAHENSTAPGRRLSAAFASGEQLSAGGVAMRFEPAMGLIHRTRILERKP
jgi:hypothetical protein